SERDAAEALERPLEQLRCERRLAGSVTLAELVKAYLAQHDVEPVTIEKLRWLLAKAVAVFRERPVGELRGRRSRRGESPSRPATGATRPKRFGRCSRGRWSGG